MGKISYSKCPHVSKFIHTKGVSERGALEDQHLTHIHTWQVGSDLVRRNLFITKLFKFQQMEA